MLALLAGALLAQSPSELVAGGYELVERLKALDVAWIETPGPDLRRAAIPHIQSALSGMVSRRISVACRDLDDARYALFGRPRPDGAAINLRFVPAIVEPGRPAQLSVTWAYLPESRRAVTVAVGQRTVRALPGRTLTLSVRLPNSESETALHPEGGFAVPVRVDSETRSVYVSAVKNGRARIAAMARATKPAARLLGQEMARSLLATQTNEQDLPYLHWLDAAERLEEGKATVADLEQVPLAREGNTYLRAMIPVGARKSARGGGSVVAVIAFHGAGGSENTYFEGCGRGLAVLEASRREWVFVAPRASPTAYEDTIRWLTGTCRFKLSKVFVLGHSMGAVPALAAAKQAPSPGGIALFAPSIAPDPPAGIRLFVAVGQDEIPGLLRTATKLGEAARAAGGTFEVVEPAEHLMVVGTAIPSAFRFLERI